MALSETGQGAEDFHHGPILHSLWLQREPKHQWRQQCGGGAGAAWQLLRLGQRRKLILLTSMVPLLPPPPLLTFDSPRRRGQSNWGWDGDHRASVTVRTHCRGPFSFPLGGLRFCVFFL
uniref:Uncharacterized protein n=1 Tax=Propithecus coquereli TaxID=379532 RepID=A0A2K6FMF5_PROCO